jgi:hypothetical protein
MAKKKLYAWDMGVWDNYNDTGIERMIVVHRNRTLARKLVKKYIKDVLVDYSSPMSRFDIDDNPESKSLPEEYNVPNKIGIY